MGEEEHDIILQKVQEAKVRHESLTIHSYVPIRIGPWTVAVESVFILKVKTVHESV